MYICYNVYTFLQSLHAGVKSIRVCLYHFRRNGHIIHVRFLPPVRGSLPNSLQICVSAKPTGRPWRSLTGWFLASKINMSAKQFCTFWLGGVILYLLVWGSNFVSFGLLKPWSPPENVNVCCPWEGFYWLTTNHQRNFVSDGGEKVYNGFLKREPNTKHGKFYMFCMLKMKMFIVPW